MAITRDTNAAQTVGTATNTLSFTVGSNDNRLLLVGIIDSTDSTTGVTYDGVAMTEEISENTSSGVAKIFSLVNPSTGANDIVATRSTGSNEFSILAASYYNCNGNINATATDVLTNDLLDIDITTTADNCWAFAVWLQDNANNNTGAGTGETLLDTTATLGRHASLDTGGVISPAGTENLSSTGANSTGNAVAVAFEPDSLVKVPTVSVPVVADVPTNPMTVNAPAAEIPLVGVVPTAENINPAWTDQSKSSSGTWTNQTKS